MKSVQVQVDVTTLASHCGQLTFVLLYCAREWSLAKTTYFL